MERRDGPNKKVLLGILEFRKDGKGEHFPAGFFGNRQDTRPIAKVLEGRLKVKTKRIVNLRGNASIRGELPSIHHGEAREW